MHDPLESVFPPLILRAQVESWPLRNVFTIARGSKTQAQVVVVEVTDGTTVGRGECVPYARYGESTEEVVETLETTQHALTKGLTRRAVQGLLPAGAARNALDCALWDFEAKQTSVPVWQRAGLPEPRVMRTTYTISLASPQEMAEHARNASAIHSLLKIKLAGDVLDIARLQAVRAAAPQVTLVADANEGCSIDMLPPLLEACTTYGVLLLEQPLPAGADDALAGIEATTFLCADESAHTTNDLEQLAQKYSAINIKLDKTGGLTEAIRMQRAAKEKGMKIMLGCMVSTSLSMAPALLLAADADFVDLDGALLLAQDREHGVEYENDTVAPPTRALWG